MSNRELRTAGMIVAAAAWAVAAVISSGSGAPIPHAGAQPSITSTATTSPAKAEFPSDDHGYLNSAARCDGGQTVMMFGRTSRSLVAVCAGPDGRLEYRGVRLNDHAGLTMAASRSADGAIVATNDDVTYSITPQTLLVSEGDTVLYRDTWAEYHSAGFPSTSATAASTNPTTTPESATPTTTSPTVSTTTVTLVPNS